MDIARLGYEIDSSQAKKAASDLDKMNASAQKAERGAKSLSNAGKNMLGGAAANIKSASDSASVFASEIDRLKSKYSPLYAASKQFEEQQLELKRALELGVISVNQYDASLAGIKGSFTVASNAAAKMAAQQAELQRQFAAGKISAGQYEAAMMRSGQASMALGGHVQGANGHVTNMMFQFQDIGMMLAAGQNPLMLAMQQGTQVSGIFKQMEGSGQSAFSVIKGGLLGMVSPLSLVTLGVIAGGAALVQWGLAAIGAGEDGKELEKIMESLADASSDLASISKDAFSPISDLKASYGAGAAEAQKLLQIEQQRAAIRAEQAVKGAISAVQGSGFGASVNDAMFELQASAMPGAFGLDGEESRIAGLISKVELLSESFGMAGEDLSILVYKLDQLDNVEGAENQAKAIQDIINYTIEASGGVQNITGQTALWFDQLLDISDETSRIAAQMEINVARGQDMLAAFRDEAELAELIKKHGADSAQVALKKLEAERRSVLAKVEALRLGKEESTAIMSAWDKANGFTDAVLASASATSNVVYGIGDITAAFDPAIVKAGQLAMAIFNARALAGRGNPDPNAPIDVEGEMAEARRRAGLFVAPTSGGGGGGGGSGGGGEDPYAKNLERLVESLQKERDTTEEWYQENLAILQDRRASELLGEQEHKDALLALEEQYQQKKREYRQQELESTLGHYNTLFGNMASIAKAGGDKATAAVKAFSIAQGLVNSYLAFTQVLADPSLIGRPGLRIALAGSTLAAGLAQVANMGGGGGGGKGRASGPTSAVAASKAEPERVTRVELIGEDWMVSLAESMMTQIYDATNNGRVIVSRAGQ